MPVLADRGRANQTLCQLRADRLGAPRVKIFRVPCSRNELVRLTEADQATIAAALGVQR